MKTTLLVVVAFVFMFISSIFDDGKTFFRNLLRDIFFGAGLLLIYHVVSDTIDNRIASKNKNSSEIINIVLTSSQSDIIVKEIEKEFTILELDTINDTTYNMTLCKQQINEK